MLTISPPALSGVGQPFKTPFPPPKKKQAKTLPHNVLGHLHILQVYNNGREKSHDHHHQS